MWLISTQTWSKVWGQSGSHKTWSTGHNYKQNINRCLFSFGEGSVLPACHCRGVASIPCHKDVDKSVLSLKSQVIQEERARVIPHPCTFIPGRQWDTLVKQKLSQNKGDRANIKAEISAFFLDFNDAVSQVRSLYSLAKVAPKCLLHCWGRYGSNDNSQRLPLCQ